MVKGSNSGAPSHPSKNQLYSLNHTNTPEDQFSKMAYGPTTYGSGQPPLLSSSNNQPPSSLSPSLMSNEGQFFIHSSTPPKLPPKPQGLKESSVGTQMTPQLASNKPSTSLMGPRLFPGNKLTPHLDMRSSLLPVDTNAIDNEAVIYDESFSDFGNSTLNSPELLYKHTQPSMVSPINTPLRSQGHQPHTISPRRSPTHGPPSFQTPSKAPYPDISFGQDLSQLPETPALDPLKQSIYGDYSQQIPTVQSSVRSTPSPQRRLMGPRPMASSSSFLNIASPSTSPIRYHNYNDHRKSWASTYSAEINEFVSNDINSINQQDYLDEDFFSGNTSSPFRNTFGNTSTTTIQQSVRKAPYPTEPWFDEINTPLPSSSSSNVTPYNAYTTSHIDKSEAPYPEIRNLLPVQKLSQPQAQADRFSTLDKFSNINLGGTIPTVGKRQSFEKQLPPPPTTTCSSFESVSFRGRTLPFSADSITARQFSQTKRIQYLSSIFEISLMLEQRWTDGLTLTAKEYRRFLHKLISFHLPKLKSFVIEDQVGTIIKSFDFQNCIFIDEETDTINFFPNVKPSGVLPALSGCYTLCHSFRSGSQYQCHSPRCSLTVYKPPVPQTFQLVKASEKLPDWATFWKISPQDLQDIPEDELKKQSHLFDLIRQQQNIIKLGRIQVDVYGPSFTNATPKLVKEVDSFTADAFESVKPLIDLHQKYLLDPLIDKLNQEGKFITGVGEIFLNWTQKAKNPYLQYTRSQANVREFIKSEKMKNSDFAKWLRAVDQQPEVMEASLDHDRIFSSGFIGHTQQLPLALGAIKKYYRTDDMEYKLIEKCIDFINGLNRRIDSLQERSLHRRNIKLLNKTLRWRNIIPIIDLDLLAEHRKLIKKSDVLFKEGWSSYAPRTLILLDNYLLITIQDEGFFKVNESPIPVSILQVELKPMDHSGNTTNNNNNSDNEEALFPFKVKHSGLGTSFTFYTDSERDRSLWFEFFKQAKNSIQLKGGKAGSGGGSSGSDPLKLVILSDQFTSPPNHRLPENSSLTLMSSQLEEALKLLNPDMKPSGRPLMESEILCGTTFQFEGKAFHLIGLNYGLFLTEAHNIEWRRVLRIPRVTQVEVLNNLVVLISSKGLYYFNLVSLLLNYYDINQERRVIGDKLSSKDNVILFKTAVHNNAKLLFVLKSNLTGSNKFKIFAPVFDVFDTFQYFQLYKRLDVDSTRIHSIITFHEYFVLVTDSEFKFEFYKYDSNFKMQRFKINTDLTTEHSSVSSRRREQVEAIKKQLKKQLAKPITLKDSHIQRKHIFLVYEEFLIIVNSVGDLISDCHVLPFNLKAKTVVICKNFLLCSNEDVIEVFDLTYDSKGFLKYECVQIIHGNGIRLINEKALIYVMMHPSGFDRQLLFSLNYMLDA